MSNEFADMVADMMEDLEWTFTPSDFEAFECMDVTEQFEFLNSRTYLMYKV